MAGKEGREYPLERTRNIGIMAHIDAGKTTSYRTYPYIILVSTIKLVILMKVLLQWTGWNRSRREVSQLLQLLQHVTGHLAGSLQTKNQVRLEHRINIIDTPGHVDFTVEVERSLRVLRWCCRCILMLRVVLNLSQKTYGVRLTHTMYLVWHSSTRWISWVQTSTMQFRSDHRLVWVKTQSAVQLPIGKEDDFTGIIDLIRNGSLYTIKMIRVKISQSQTIPEDYEGSC